MISAPGDLFIRTADTVQLATAHEIGESDVCTNDRHMLAAAAYFGLTGLAGPVSGRMLRKFCHNRWQAKPPTLPKTIRVGAALRCGRKRYGDPQSLRSSLF
jgi:hypothetical protein